MEQFDNVLQIDGNVDINENQNQMQNWIQTIERTILSSVVDKSLLPDIKVPEVDLNCIKICDCDCDCLNDY